MVGNTARLLHDCVSSRIQGPAVGDLDLDPRSGLTRESGGEGSGDEKVYNGDGVGWDPPPHTHAHTHGHECLESAQFVVQRVDPEHRFVIF